MAANKGRSGELSQDDEQRKPVLSLRVQNPDPSPEEGQLCGLQISMWDHIEECHPEEEDWFEKTFSMYEVV